MAAESRSIQQLMQKLPQELFDTIYDLTFTVKQSPRDIADITHLTPNGSDRSNDAHRSILHCLVTLENPQLLLVDRRSRSKLLNSFYGDPDAVFIVANTATLHWLCIMLSVFEPEHLEMIQSIRCLDPTDVDEEDKDMFEFSFPSVAKKVSWVSGEEGETNASME